MKVASWITGILAYLAIPVMLMFWKFSDDGMGVTGLFEYLIVGAVFWLILGFISHILIAKYRNTYGGQTFWYVSTFVPYIIPFIIFYAIILILTFIDWFIYVIFDKHYVLNFIKSIKEMLFGTKRPTAKDISSGDACVIIDNGFERVLVFIETKQDHDNGKMYNRFRDDTDKYWRSYDGNQTFIKETLEQTSRGY